MRCGCLHLLSTLTSLAIARPSTISSVRLSGSIVMEYADGGDLEQKIEERRNRGCYFKEGEIWGMFGQMLAGVARLHQLGILHRDIKSANFYLTRSGTIKLGDLNVSKVIRKTGMCQTQTGAPYYSSPQIWNEKPYDTKSDMWSLGCVLYQLINLKLPFKARDMEGLFKKVTRGYYSRINKSYSEDLVETLKCLINVQPGERLGCRELMQMPFVKRNLRRHRDGEIQEKSALLKTIKLNKNLSFLNSSLPKSNYAQAKCKCLSPNHNHSMLQKSNSLNIRSNSSSVKLQKITPSMKLSLPPVPGVLLLNKNEKVVRYRVDPQEQPQTQRKISSEKNQSKRYKRARSYMRK